jgi:hypothetical protein
VLETVAVGVVEEPMRETLDMALAFTEVPLVPPVLVLEPPLVLVLVELVSVLEPVLALVELPLVLVTEFVLLAPTLEVLAATMQTGVAVGAC